MKDTEAIALPPLRPPERHGPRLPVWLRAGILLLVLALGFGAGWWLRSDRAEPGQSGDSPDAAVGGDPLVIEAEGGESEAEAEAQRLQILQAARLAMADEDWAGAQRRYQRVMELDPDNDEARAMLPRIVARLDALRGGLKVEVTPSGATAAIAGMAATAESGTALEIEQIPAGVHRLVISLDGYQTVEREVRIVHGDVIELPPIALPRSVGGLKVSSQPEGVGYLVRRLPYGAEIGAAEPDRGTIPESQVVERGVTPADLPELAIGSYEIQMSLDGWPEHRETVEVRNKRETHVSHVFARGGLQIISDPSGADVWLQAADEAPGAGAQRGERVGQTPLSLTEVPSGRHRIALVYEDWAPIERIVEVMADEELKLEFAWKRGLVTFVSDPPGAEVFLGGDRVGTLEDRTPFQWEFPEGDYAFRAVLPESDLDDVGVEWSVRADVDNEARFAFGHGSVSIRTDPPGATVMAGDRVVGTTPFSQPLLRPGRYAYTLRKDNYAAVPVAGEVEPGQELSFNVKLEFNPNPERGRDFVNGEGMTMRWIEGLRGWVGVHEVDQNAYQSVMGDNPSLFRRPDLPVDSVSWNDAVQFCARLNRAERTSRQLPERYAYRLPTDEEWSYFSAGAELDDAVTSKGQRRTKPEPVGSSEANRFGLHDVRGNVWEWCEDWYSTAVLNRMSKGGLVGNPSLAATEHKFVRGGSWSGNQDYELSPGWRSPLEPTTANKADVGFRVVLMPE